jgi:hypothetical protein
MGIRLAWSPLLTVRGVVGLLRFASGWLAAAPVNTLN